MSGYSGTPLAEKLGIRAGVEVVTFAAPEHLPLLMDPLPDGATVRADPGAPGDMALCFATEAAELDRLFRLAMTRIPATGAIWVAWPKKASSVPTDVSEDLCRRMFLPTGMVATKVCAIDEIWSGLRFVVRKELRDDWGGTAGRVTSSSCRLRWPRPPGPG